MRTSPIKLTSNAPYCQTAPIKLDIGQAIGPLPDFYTRYGQTGFLSLLERYRPAHLLSHQQAVVMHGSVDDLENSGGDEWLYELEVAPNSHIQRHDVYWANQIACLNDLDPSDADPFLIKNIAEKYWHGETSHDPVWEYLAAQAIVVAVHSY
jgi:hypothetical protein